MTEQKAELIFVLRRACIDGDIETIKNILLEEDRNFYINEIIDETTRNTLLHIACREGQLEIVKLISVQRHVDLNQRNISGETPFFCACMNQRLDVMNYLCQNPKVDINSPNTSRCTPLCLACCNSKYIDVVKILLKQSSILINQSDIYGWSPLHRVCWTGDLEMTKLLCENEKEIDYLKRNKVGETAFYIACLNGHFNIVNYLLLKYPIHNHYENQITSDGVSPLYVASKNGDLNIVQLLCKNAPINKMDD
eukprot:c14644_g1_i1.p1 GENE.c14644_g1_i1~~c14644_g1_i1.p1  ORF type:complete len:252 (-),score=93.86 c14644_g1_i1:148-903(-)